MRVIVRNLRKHILQQLKQKSRSLIPLQCRAICLKSACLAIETAAVDEFFHQFVCVPSEGSILTLHQNWRIGTEPVAMGPNCRLGYHIVFNVDAKLKCSKVKLEKYVRLVKPGTK